MDVVHAASHQLNDNDNEGYLHNSVRHLHDRIIFPFVAIICILVSACRRGRNSRQVSKVAQTFEIQIGY